MHLHHWSLNEIPFEFKIEIFNTWDIHKFAYVSNERKFTILADGSRGPLIIEYPNCIGTLF